jgi:branched-chain amino acid transport system ATP-binding protein
VLENVLLAFQAHDGIRSFNLLASAGARDWTRSSALEVIDLVGLKDNATALAGEISYGEQRLLEIALALAGQPKLLLLDEPAAGIGLSELSHLSALISELARRYTVLLIEHNVEMVMQLCQIITVLYRGHVLTTGSPRDIAENEDVNAVYLGGG